MVDALGDFQPEIAGSMLPCPDGTASVKGVICSWASASVSTPQRKIILTKARGGTDEQVRAKAHRSKLWTSESAKAKRGIIREDAIAQTLASVVLRRRNTSRTATPEARRTVNPTPITMNPTNDTAAAR